MKRLVLASRIPEKVLNNFCDHCDSISGLHDDTKWAETRDTILSTFGARYSKSLFTFESDAHYQWFLLRYT